MLFYYSITIVVLFFISFAIRSTTDYRHCRRLTVTFYLTFYFFIVSYYFILFLSHLKIITAPTYLILLLLAFAILKITSILRD